MPNVGRLVPGGFDPEDDVLRVAVDLEPGLDHFLRFWTQVLEHGAGWRRASLTAMTVNDDRLMLLNPFCSAHAGLGLALRSAPLLKTVVPEPGGS